MKRALVALLATLVSTPAAAYQVSGTFLYRDREFGINGFTGSEPNRPIRFADVEVVDNNTQQVLATGATDANGSFSVQVNDGLTRNLQVRVLTDSDNTGDLHIQVRDRATSSAVYGIARVYPNHPAVDLQFVQPVVAVQDTAGDAFNIYDVAVDAMDFIAFHNGSRPGASQSLTLLWYKGSGNGTYYSHGSRSIFLLGLASDSDAWDDSVILHEIGHYAEFVFADSDNPGGDHFLNDCHDMRLTWSEGWSTFFQNMIRDWLGLQRPEIYVDTSGRPGPGGVLLSYEVEGPSVGRTGAGNEVAVNAALWDLVDNLATQDRFPGFDDDPMRVTDGPTRCWDVMLNHIGTAAANNITAEDFWNGWFALGKGNDADVEAIFADHGMEYFADAFEDDTGVATARDGGVADATTHHTIYGAGDSDWTRFAGVAGGQYTFETRNLPCGSDTRLELYDSDGTTLLALHNDRNPNPPNEDLSSIIIWNANRDGPVYLRVRRNPDVHRYTSYDLVVNIDRVPVLLTDFVVTATADGALLRWHAVDESGFSHFDVERSTSRDGPWTRVNAEPIAAHPQDATLYEFSDPGVQPGDTCFYRVVGIETNGERATFGPYAFTMAVPARVVLHPPRPNPFNPNTTLRFELPQAGHVWLRVYDVSGRLVRTLVRGDALPAGPRDVAWNGRDDGARPAPSGVYVVRLDAAGKTQTQRALLVR